MYITVSPPPRAVFQGRLLDNGANGAIPNGTYVFGKLSARYSNAHLFWDRHHFDCGDSEHGKSAQGCVIYCTQYTVEGRWFKSRMAPSFFFVCLLHIFFLVVCVMSFVASVSICTMMIEVSSEQSRSQFYMQTWYIESSAAAAAAAAAVCVAILLLLLQQQCCCFLLLFVIVCRMTFSFAASLNLIPVFSFPSFKRDLFLMYPLAVLCRIYSLDLPIIDTR